MDLSFIHSMTPIEKVIIALMIFFTFWLICSLPGYMRKYKQKRKEKERDKKNAIQWLVNTLQKIEDKYHKSFIDWYKNNI